MISIWKNLGKIKEDKYMSKVKSSLLSTTTLITDNYDINNINKREVKIK